MFFTWVDCGVCVDLDGDGVDAVAGADKKSILSGLDVGILVCICIVSETQA